MSFRMRILLVSLAALASVIAMFVIALSPMAELTKLAREIGSQAERQAMVDSVEREMLSRVERVYRTMAIGDGGDAAMGAWVDAGQSPDADRRIFPGSAGWAQYFEPDAGLERLWKNFGNAAEKTPMTVEGAMELHSAKKALGDQLAILRDRAISAQRGAVRMIRIAPELIAIDVWIKAIACFLMVLVIAAFCVRGATLRLNRAISDISDISARLTRLAHSLHSGGNEIPDNQPNALTALSTALDGVNGDLLVLRAGRRWRLRAFFGFR